MGDFVICANDVASIDSGSNFNSAFSFQNYLQDTITLPPNCEVAVQSVKINRNGQLVISRDSDFGFYFGAQTLDRKLVTSICKRVQNSITRGQYNPSDLTDIIKLMISNAMCHPEIYLQNTVSVRTDANGLFDGFHYKYGQLPAHSGVNDFTSIVQTIQQAYPDRRNRGMSYNSSNHRITALGPAVTGATGPGTNFNLCQVISAPMCLNNGYYEINVGDLRTGGTNGTSAWSVGLCRSLENRLAPSHFVTGTDADFGNAATRVSDVYENREQFYDFVVSAVQPQVGGNRFIRVYHAIKNNRDVRGQTITMKEIKYYERPGNAWEGTNAANTGCNWSQTMVAANNQGPKKGQKLRFYINNEVISCDMLFEDSVGDGTDVSAWIPLVTDPTTDDPVVAKRFYFKPICDSCRMLYPRLWIKKGGSHMVLVNGRQRHKLSGDVGQYDESSYGRPNLDYMALKESENEMADIIDLDTRFYNDYTDAEVYTYNSINTDSIADNYDFGMIFTDNVYGAPWTLSGNGAEVFGFQIDGADDGEYFATPANDGDGNFIAEINSDTRPVMEAINSVFVALKNIRVKSYNANKTARSQILYQIPRFDNAGTSTGGGLYFEPSERLYISCNNPEPLTINTFEINLVNHDETLAQDITGRTVVCLHFRQGTQSWYRSLSR
jgi:hypothetical protein